MSTDFLDQNIIDLEHKDLRRHLKICSSSQASHITLNGKRVLNFCSNNYLGLADDPRIVRAASDAMQKYGFGAGASRLVSGNMASHEDLENAIAQYKKSKTCLVFNSGYVANIGTIAALFNREDIIFADKFNHASIIDGIMLSRAELKRYPHLDMQALEQGLKDTKGYKKRLIVTDTVFSMDGDLAPLSDIFALAKRYDAWVMTDDAHAFGILEEQEFNTIGERYIQMGTLSKAVGCFGAYVCGSLSLREYLINHARSLIYTTAMPPAMAAAAHCAVNIICQEPQRRSQLNFNADYVREGLKSIGFDTMNSTTPIIPILIKDSAKAMGMSRQLLEQGIFVQAIRPPTVPINGARLRLTVMATHTKEDLDYLLSRIKACQF